MTERVIATIGKVRYVKKVGKYVVQLTFEGAKAKEYWLTEKQYDKLCEAFDKTPHGYSTKKIQITGVFNDKGYYAWCKVVRPPWEPPTQYDLHDLEDEDDT